PDAAVHADRKAADAIEQVDESRALPSVPSRAEREIVPLARAGRRRRGIVGLVLEEQCVALPEIRAGVDARLDPGAHPIREQVRARRIYLAARVEPDHLVARD